jgi:hypothetical protein
MADGRHTSNFATQFNKIWFNLDYANTENLKLIGREFTVE